MTTRDRILPARIQRSPDLLQDHLIVAYNSNKENRAIENEQEESPKKAEPDEFKSWCMPDTPHGYIKPKKNNLL